MNPDLQRLHPYPFERLRELLAGVVPPAEKSAISLAIGEPKHPAPEFILQKLAEDRASFANYPFSQGTSALRETITTWLNQRFDIKTGLIDPEKHVIPVNGTREALFAIAQAVIDRTKNPLVIMPNPFYQIYEGAALLAGAEPYYLNTTAENNYLPDFESVPSSVWQRCQLIYICSPGNPTGAVIQQAQLHWLIDAAHRYDFVIASDECYSELYPDEENPPTGLLAAARTMGNDSFSRCLVFHSLSKRSNLPGLRSGFIAGDALIMNDFLRYRTYHGCAMPLPAQAASIAAWRDEAHVKSNRDAYREKFQVALEVLSPVVNCKAPDAGFYLWPKLTLSDTEFTKRLYSEENVLVLPGSFLSRDTERGNPGAKHVRIALVAETNICEDAVRRIRAIIES